MTNKAQSALALFKEFEGEHEGVSEWQQITQEQINQFADATLDHQFIHVDPERAAKTPFGTTIAHGFLTLSLIPHLGSSIPQLRPAAYEGLRMGVNYGLDRVRFMSPVKVNARVRASRKLVSAELKGEDTVQLKHEVTIEIEGSDKPACIAETLSRMVYER